MPRSTDTALVTIGPMRPGDAATIASTLTGSRFSDALNGHRVATVTGIGTEPSPRQSFTGGELEMLIHIAALCWGQQRDGVPGRPIVTAAQARLTMRAYHLINGLPLPTPDQLRAARSTDY
jgi:hypothetical protein